MGKSIYTYYKERLIEIGGANKCLYLKGITRKSSYDLGKIFEGRDEKIADFIKFLSSRGKHPFPIIDKSEKGAILQNLDVKIKLNTNIPEDASPDEKEKLGKKIGKATREAEARAIEAEISRLKELKREVEEIEKETGRYELYIGYPFVFGTLAEGFNKTLIKAPLLLFPVRINIPDENTVELSLIEGEKIRINPALIFAYAQSKRVDVDSLELELDDLSSFKGGYLDVIKYLASSHVKIEGSESKNLFAYSRFKEPTERELSVRHGAVLGRFPLSNSIYNDYSLLEKKKLTNDAIVELLRMKKQKIKKPKKVKKAKNPPPTAYAVRMLDYAQADVVDKVSKMGNMVIYGPPGTGKSQTIVNIISDAIVKGKRVLVVSQKKAALDVVYNRLGTLSDKAMYISDEAKEKRRFYDKCLTAHTTDLHSPVSDTAELQTEYTALDEKIRSDTERLNAIHSLLCEKRPFGLSLSEMYSSSYSISKTSNEYAVYCELIKNDVIMSLNYKELSDALFVIRAKNLERLYYDFVEEREKNPVISHMLPGLDILTISEVKASIEAVAKSRKGFFNTAKYPYYRQVLAYYNEVHSEDTLDIVVKRECKIRYPKKLFTGSLQKEIKAEFLNTVQSIDAFVKEYDPLLRVLTLDGYIAVIDNIIRGNYAYVKLVFEALDGYIAQRDTSKLLDSLDRTNIEILNFAYKNSKNYQSYVSVIEKLTVLRIYHELIRYETEYKDDLAQLLDFSNITSRIYKNRERQLQLATSLAGVKSSLVYEKMFEEGKDNKDYLYQISKKQKLWPIRKTMELYGEYILTLFPCWLLSPENVSSLLPLVKNMFDLVIFDEASQVFIESTIPTIYRGKSIVVAGDSKQLRPSTTFMKRYLGHSPDAEEDVSVQAALEVDSLLDLAVARYNSANLTYHYRSRCCELIEFSNRAFYGGKLQVAPNISRNVSSRPIQRHLVKGKWQDRKNVVEAERVVELLYEIFATRKNNESIGIITFNSEQQSCIADCIDKKMSEDAEFRSFMTKETHRIENGEDTSIFIKNLENVQGDERDIIIFSIGYAKNNEGKLYTSFGSLSAEGGENRLNVAITRAKSKIIVVTSIEPEELKIEGAKNLGPKLLKKYLTYVRAVSNGDKEEAEAILTELDDGEDSHTTPGVVASVLSVEEQIKEKLTKLGYTIDTSLGNKNSRISLAIYDEKRDRYLLGIELDTDAFALCPSALERDVYKPKFLEGRGWTLMRVWTRDWWLYPQKVIKSITSLAEKNKKL